MKKGIFFFLSLILLCIAFIPQILSTSPGKNYLARTIAKRLNCEVKIGSLSLRWWSPQVVYNVEFQKGDILFSSQVIEYRGSLYSLLFSQPDTSALALQGGSLSDKGKLLLQNITLLANTFQGNHPSTNTMAIKGSYRENDSFTLLLSECPTDLFELFSPFPLSLLFGNEVDGDFELIKNANASLNLHSPQFALKTTGTFQDKTYFLSSPLALSFYLTPALSQYLFPKAESAPVSRNPIYLQVDSSNASISLKKPFTFKNCTFPKAVLNLGILEIENLTLVTNLFSIIDLSFRFHRATPLWFQLMPLSLTNGLLQITRTEVLLDYKYQLALWNKIDLSHRTLDLYVGLSSSLLRTVLGLDFLPYDYTIPVHITGPIQNPSVDKSTPLQNIAALMILKNSPIRIAPPQSENIPKPRPPFPWSK